MGKRRLSRELALQFLYQYDISNELNSFKLIDFEKLVEDFLSSQEIRIEPDVSEFMSIICRGVLENIVGIDEVISQYCKNWRIGRMANIDRNILRISVYEMVYLRNIPPPVTINEAIEVGRKYGNEETASFVNGVLDRVRIAKEKGDI